MRVLVAEDFEVLARSIGTGLRREGMAVDVVLDGDDALEHLAVTRYDVVVLDRDLPGVHGDEVCRRIAADGGGSRVLMLTAASTVRDRVEGLGLGAVDYLPKPFDFAELVARVRALARRSAPAAPPVLEAAGLTLDPGRKSARRDGRRLDLSPKEFAVLECLLAADGRVVSAEELLERVWDEMADPFTTAVKSTIRRLRGKLGEPPVIETVREGGYPRGRLPDRGPVIFSGTLRIRLALLYGGVFLVLALMVLAFPLLAVSETTHVGATTPPVVSHPFRAALPELSAALITLAIAVAASLGFGWLLAGRLLRPLRAIVATARDISATNLSRRLRTSGRDDEFSRLAQTLNDLFGRLEAAFESQRHFVANAAHELRTPLTAERTVLQVALRDPDASLDTLRAACDEVLRLGRQQQKLIDALLTLAGSERGIARPEPFDLAAIAAAVTEDAAIAATLGPAPADGAPRLAQSLVANLVANAITHNVAGGWAEIETGTADGRAVLRVANSGPVVPPGELDRLFQPFQRLGDERVRQRREDGRGHEQGHGLGLAIVRAIAAAHRAELTACARPEGGLDITVRFPLSQAAAPQGAQPSRSQP